MQTRIIQSILDDDLYKFSMMQVILQHYPEAHAELKFINRGGHRFSQALLNAFSAYLHDDLPRLALTSEELSYLASLNLFAPWFLAFLSTYRYDPEEVRVELHDVQNGTGLLSLHVSGPWYRVMLWEVKLMAILCELYFRIDATQWQVEGYGTLTEEKVQVLQEHHCCWADFGTRRRRSAAIHDLVVEKMLDRPGFLGTSNVHLARKYGVRPIGTMAHEFIQGMSVLESMNHPDRYAMKLWSQVYQGKLGIALADTYGSDAFLRDFTLPWVKLYDGVRHDSGDPFAFGEKIIRHYEQYQLDPRSKMIVFSDGLSAQRAAAIADHFQGRIETSFGIGTSFTNDFTAQNSPALNIVIKLHRLNNQDVVKLSDEAGKESGAPEAVALMRAIHGTYR